MRSSWPGYPSRWLFGDYSAVNRKSRSCIILWWMASYLSAPPKLTGGKIFILSSGDNDCLTMITHNSTQAVTYGGEQFFSGYQSHVVEFFMPKENYDSSLVQGTILAGTGSFFTLLLLSRNYIFVSINTTLHNIDNYCSQTKETQTMKNNEIKSKKYQQHGANIFSSTCQLM